MLVKQQILWVQARIYRLSLHLPPTHEVQMPTVRYVDNETTVVFNLNFESNKYLAKRGGISGPSLSYIRP